MSLKEIEILRAGEYPCSKPLLNDNGPAAILGLINYWGAFALLLYWTLDKGR